MVNKRMLKFYGLAVLGAAIAAAANSPVLLGLTTSIVILLYMMEK